MPAGPFDNYDDAFAAYSAISPNYAKILYSEGEGLLEQYGGSTWVNYCIDEAVAYFAAGAEVYMVYSH